MLVGSNFKFSGHFLVFFHSTVLLSSKLYSQPLILFETKVQFSLLCSNCRMFSVKKILQASDEFSYNSKYKT